MTKGIRTTQPRPALFLATSLDLHPKPFSHRDPRYSRHHAFVGFTANKGISNSTVRGPTGRTRSESDSRTVNVFVPVGSSTYNVASAVGVTHASSFVRTRHT